MASWRCTGTQMDADTFLTAGHCTYGADAVAIWYGDDVDHLTGADFDVFTDAKVNADAYSYSAISHPEYDDAGFYLHDVGIVDEVVLNEGTSFDAYGELPELGYWDAQLALNKKFRDSFTTVGYGLQWATPTRGNSPDNPNRRANEERWVKLQAGGELINNRQFNAGKGQDAYVVLTNNARTGGTCSGDSGGPTFIDGSNIVVAVTSFGVNETCAGTSGVYRIDTADDLAWIGQFVD
ncbi:trypsin-like serine protease [Ornithinimicrobium panacihumi]|uniref:trypsin-like serine protease n=1 Tax=Ornithinimicrobium panacihumi TaxID=2008449 RepID=UPI003F8BCF45